MVPGFAAYGATKCGLRYLTEALAKECEGSSVKVSAISPGMVATDFLWKQREHLGAEEWAKRERIFNLLADKPQTVAPWLVKQMLANDRNGARLAWLTTPKLLLRIFPRLLGGPRHLFAEFNEEP